MVSENQGASSTSELLQPDGRQLEELCISNVAISQDMPVHHAVASKFLQSPSSPREQLRCDAHGMSKLSARELYGHALGDMS